MDYPEYQYGVKIESGYIIPAAGFVDALHHVEKLKNTGSEVKIVSRVVKYGVWDEV